MTLGGARVSRRVHVERGTGPGGLPGLRALRRRLPGLQEGRGGTTGGDDAAEDLRDDGAGGLRRLLRRAFTTSVTGRGLLGGGDRAPPIRRVFAC